MQTIQIKSQVNISDLLDALEELSLPELEKIAEKTLQVRAKLIAPSLSQEETSLYAN